MLAHALYYPGIVNPSDMWFIQKDKTMNDAKDVHTELGG